MKKHLRVYEKFRKKKLTFHTFDYEFYDDFIMFLTGITFKDEEKIITGLKVILLSK